MAACSSDVRLQLSAKALDDQLLNKVGLLAAWDAVAGTVAVKRSSSHGAGNHGGAPRHVFSIMECRSPWPLQFYGSGL